MWKTFLQDVLLKNYQYCSNGKSVIYLKSWLYKITQNTIIDFHKKNNKTVSFDLDIVAPIDENSIIGEASDYIKILLKLLPDDYATPLLYVWYWWYRSKTIAENLKMTLPNTKSRIQRARVKLKEKILEFCVVSFGESGEMVSFDIKPECTTLKEAQERIENKV